MRRGWIGFGLLVLLIGAVVTLRGTAGNDSPEHSSASDAGNGTSALRYYAQALGHSTSTVEGDFSLPASHALLFVFTPSTGYDLAQAQQLQAWIAAGNLLVYAAETGDPVLDNQLGIHRSTASVDAAGQAAAPILGGVHRVSGAIEAHPLVASAAQVPLLRNGAGDVLAWRSSVGSGVLVALADPLILCNGYLRLADDGRFAADLLAMTPASGAVLFDEFHHGAAAGASPAVAWLSTTWGAALTFAVLIIFAGLALRGRGFGPPVAIASRPDRSSGEYAAAVGSLLQRTGARKVAIETLLAATQRSIAERVGLSNDIPPAQLSETLAQRAPALARRLAEVERAVASAEDSEQRLLDTAQRMHELAYPAIGTNDGGRTK